MGRGLFATGTRGFGGRLVAGIGPPGDPRSERSTLLLTSPVLEVGGLSGCPAVRLESVYYPVYRLLFVRSRRDSWLCEPLPIEPKLVQGVPQGGLLVAFVCRVKEGFLAVRALANRPEAGCGATPRGGAYSAV